MPLFITSHKTPVGTLNLLADDQILIGANLSTVSAFKAGKDVKIVKAIPVISDLINDYFDGDLTALNGIKVRQPGAPFSQAAWKAMRKIAPGKTWSYSDLAEKLEALQRFAQLEVPVLTMRSCLLFLATAL